MLMLKVIHIAKSLKKAKLTSQNLSKSMPLPTLQTERKIMFENTTKICIKISDIVLSWFVARLNILVS